jgi:hypothetical protein
VAEITKVGWGGPVLARVHPREGLVRGADIAAATMEITDAGGRGLQRNRLDQIEAYFAGGADRAAAASIRWSQEVDGKKLLVARFPLTVTVTVTASDGGTTRVSREVRK